MLLTIAVATPLFPALSTNSNVNTPFFVNTLVALPLLFVIVISSLKSVNVTTTSLLVGSVILYLTFAVGTTLSMLFTVAMAVPLFPALSINSNVNVPLFSKL